MCAILYFSFIVYNKSHANPTIIYENIKEIHILAAGGILEFPFISHMLLRRDNCSGFWYPLLALDKLSLQVTCYFDSKF